MITPQIPIDERGGIREPHGLELLDSDPEARFDRYTKLIKRFLDVPIVLVSLVDGNRQWFRSRQGPATQTSSDGSFRGHSIPDDDVFVIEDATRDPRFCDNPLVTSAPNVRFYAGCPIPGPTGQKLGTLCVADHRPRIFETEDIETLKDFAALITNEMASLQLATTDELTGISNRRGFEMLAQQALAMSTRAGHQSVAAMIDLDGFKRVNDRFGHEAGDAGLIEFSELLVQNFRDCDLVGRFAGDEFCVLLINSNIQVASVSISRLQAAIDKRNLDPEKPFPLAFSAGVSLLEPGQHECLWDVMREADAGMYEVKKSKKARKAPGAG